MAKRKQNLKETLSLVSIFGKISGKKDVVLVATYSGGGDSGEIDLDDEFLKELKEIDPKGFDVNEEKIADTIDSGLGYGSWAGEFSAGGSVYWDNKLKKFTADGYETEEVPREFEFDFEEEE